MVQLCLSQPVSYCVRHSSKSRREGLIGSLWVMCHLWTNGLWLKGKVLQEDSSRWGNGLSQEQGMLGADKAIGHAVTTGH